MSLQRRIYEKAYCKISLQSHPDKNEHQQASAVMRMINEAKEGLKYLLQYNDATRGKGEDLQRREESWREDETIRNGQLYQ